MGDFSIEPLQNLIDNQVKGYVGLHLEQGVPVMDRDINLLNDLISSTVRSVITRYIGNGMARGLEGFAIDAIPGVNDFIIEAGALGDGVCLVGGLEVIIETAINYSAQSDVLTLNTPNATQPDPREDIVYLDVWLEEVDGLQDNDLLNHGDVGIQTSVRQRPIWKVRVAEGIPAPTADPGHVHYELARLTRPRNESNIEADMITDLRQVIRPLAQVEERLALLESLVVLPAFDQPPGEFVPPFGGEGTAVTLSGRNFDMGTPRVFLGTDEVTVNTFTAETIGITVPAGLTAGPVKITVMTDVGSVTSIADFTVLASTPPVGDAPVFTSPTEFAPPFGGVATTVTLFGDHFDAPGLTVEFDTQILSIDSVNTGGTPHEIVVTIPSGFPSGAVNITVTTDFGSVTSSNQFTVL
jgi:hypothetical protein